MRKNDKILIFCKSVYALILLEKNIKHLLERGTVLFDKSEEKEAKARENKHELEPGTKE